MRLLTLILFCLLSSCASHTILYDSQAAHLPRRAAIVFVPGFYGTALADAETGERHFLSAWKSLFGSVPLALTEPDLGIEGARPLRTDGILENVPIVPLLYSFNVYGDAFDYLRDQFGEHAEVVPFAYDWRQDVWKITDDLAKVVQSLHDGGASPIVIVGHSMGGLVTAHFLRRYPQAPVKAAVIAAAPFGGVATAFRNLQLGTSVGTAKTPLNAMALSTFPSMYYLMSAPDTQAYRNRTFQKLGDSIYNPELWQRWHWGIYRETPPGSRYAKARAEATARYLAQAEKAAAFLRATAPRSDKQVLVYIGTGQQTFARVQWTGATLADSGHWLFREDSARQLAADATLFADGDGTVPTFAATPPPGFRAAFPGRTVSAPAQHAAIFGDDAFRATLRSFLNKEGGIALGRD